MTVYHAPHNKRPIFVIATTFILTLLALLFLMFLGMPAILSTGWGQAPIKHYANEKFPGKIEFKNLSLSWLGAQELEGLVYRDPAGKTVQIGTFLCQTPLLSLLWQRGARIDAEVKDLHLQIPEGGDYPPRCSGKNPA